MSTTVPLNAQVCNLDSLPSPPHVAIKVIELSKDQDKGVRDLSDVLSLDSALSAAILRIANSTAYSRGRVIDSIHQAVSVMGAKATVAVALGFSLKQSFPSWSHPSGLSGELLWRRNVATAVASRSLVRLLGNGNEQRAFLCGLLSRIGQLVLHTAAKDAYERVLSESDTCFPSPELERKHCGLSHHEIAFTLLSHWKLPDDVCEAVRDWGEVVEGRKTDSPLTSIVTVADAVAGLLTGDNQALELERVRVLADSLLGITEHEIERMFMSSEEELKSTLSVFGDPHSDQINCEAILEEARQRLILMSIGLAADLATANNKSTQLEEANRSLVETANTDVLTRLPNRAALQKETDALWECWRRNPARRFAVVMMDIDHFKSFNDSKGHAAGDRVLQGVGRALRDVARGTDFVARYGGEEFTILLANAHPEQAAIAAERFRSAVENLKVSFEGETLSVTASFGVAFSGDIPEAQSFEEFVEAADKALYISKRGGRNRVSFYGPMHGA
ncbi:MAG: GGDEF domain-containing protein [Planctomycetales bacterium]|nr:GGDEF domain-containing protein [Planctomycetales bacterium]